MANRSLYNCQRIMQLLDKVKKGKEHKVFITEVQLAIMKVAGMDMRTIKQYIKHLKQLNWLSRQTYAVFYVTGQHLDNDLF